MKKTLIGYVKTVLLTAGALVTALASPLALAACGGDTTSVTYSDVIADFSEGSSDKFYASDGFSNGGAFNCTWYADNIRYEDSVMKLTFDRDEEKGIYTSGELRSHDFYGYGMFTVCMKPLNKSGMISSFFTYTDGRDNGNPHDEIDIEFLGYDMNVVQFNYYTSGKGGHEVIYELGFDASEDFHTYGFDWSEDRIVWYVDDMPVHISEEDIPVTPAKIMMNVWNPTWDTSYEWVGRFDENTGIPGHAEYKWIKYSK